MKQLIHLKSTISPWVRGPIRYSPLARVFLLAAVLFACLALSQTARAANPGPSYLTATNGIRWRERWRAQFQEHDLIRAAAHDHHIRCSGRGHRSVARAQSRSPSTRRGQSRDATLTRAMRFTLFMRHSERGNHHARRPARGTGPGRALDPFQHQPGRRDRGLLQRRERSAFHGFLRTPDGVITTFDVLRCGHRLPAEAHLRRQHQPARGDRGTLR